MTYAVVGFAVEWLVANAAHSVKPWIARADRRFNRVSGGLFVAFGALLPIRLESTSGRKRPSEIYHLQFSWLRASDHQPIDGKRL